jgi:hypothetical protein
MVRGAACESYLVLLVCAAASLLLLGIGLFVMTDTWLALVAGRAVATSGPPATDSLTTWTLGRDWVDQQWLGQFVLYEIWRAGGLVLVGLVHVVVVIGTFVMCLTGARRRGGSTRHVAGVGLLAVLPIGLVAANIRTQTFALALFALVLWLLAEDSRRPSGRVFWCFPLLALWANVHGSVIAGAALVVLAGVASIAAGVRSRRPPQLARGAVMIGMAAVALLITPYGFGLFSYLGDLFGNPEIARISSDWMPTTLEPVQIPFFLLAGLTVALIARHRDELTLFELLALLLVIVGALAAQRNLAWFGLAAVLLVPALLTRGRADPAGPPPPVRVAAAVSAIGVAGVVVAGIAGLTAVGRQVESTYPAAAAEIVAHELAADRSLRVMTHPQYADWLLFRYPQLAGRIPFDIRFELLTPAELRRFRRFRDQVGADWRGALGGARLVVLDSSDKPLEVLPPTSAVLLREPGARQLYGRHHVSVILRPTPASASRRPER